MDTNDRCVNKDKKDEEKLESQNEVMKFSASAVAPENVTSDPQSVDEEEVCYNTIQDLRSELTKAKQNQRQLRAKYMKLLEEVKAYEETLDIVKSAKPLPITTISEVMNMRRYMKGALAAVEKLPELTSFGQYNDGGKMMSRLRQAVQELDAAVSAGDNEHAILVNLNKIFVSNAQRETYLPIIYNLVQSASLPERDELKENLKNVIERQVDVQKKVEQQILEIEKDIETRQKSGSESQGGGA